MYFTPTAFLAKLLAAMQVLMTLDMLLSTTTMALPVTSKPLESTVENSAWQAWIELPPEQKQQVKSRKVTPKSIFTLPLRVECPEGHKQVDTKCIPIVIGTNDVLIDLNALGLLVGSTQTEDLYDYDDMSEEVTNPFAFSSGIMPMGETAKAVNVDVDGLNVELKPPSKDEPLKFNIFENKFQIFHEEPSEDYSSLSNEASPQSTEKEQNATVIEISQPTNASLIAAANITAINNLASDVSNFSETDFDFYEQKEKNFTSSDSEANESNPLTTLAHGGVDFKIDAISVPAFSFEALKPTAEQKPSALHPLGTDDDDTTVIVDRDKPKENDIQTLLQTESFLPLLNQTTAAAWKNENFSVTTIALQEPSESSSDVLLSLNVDDEEITTLPNIMERDVEVEVKNKQEYTRSVTLNPMIIEDSSDTADDDDDDNDDGQEVKDSTLETVTNIELLEIATPIIQLDETTIIETDSSLYFASSAQKEIKELLFEQEQQVQNAFEELHQKDQHHHVVLKKSKVQPVEVLATSSNNTTTATTAATTSVNLPAAEAAAPSAAANSTDELISAPSSLSSASSSTEEKTVTVTPLLTGHNENDNNNKNNNKNDRFHYQQFKNQVNEVTQRSSNECETQKTLTTTAIATAPVSVSVSVATTGITKTTTTESTEIATISLTSEIDLAEELRLINALVKGIPPPTTTNKTTTTTTTATTTTERPKASSTTTNKISTNDIELSSSSLSSAQSESSATTKKLIASSSEIWSKIMPLLTTSSTTPMTKSSTNEGFDQSDQKKDSFAFNRSNRNSKITRIDNFNSMSSSSTGDSTAGTVAATSTTAKFYDDNSTPSLIATSSSRTTSSENLTSSTESNAYEPYWWLPVSWRLDSKPTSSEKQSLEQEVKAEEQPSLLLRFWSAYIPKSS